MRWKMTLHFQLVLTEDRRCLLSVGASGYGLSICGEVPHTVVGHVVRFDGDFSHVFLCSIAEMTDVMPRHPADIHTGAGYS